MPADASECVILFWISINRCMRMFRHLAGDLLNRTLGNELIIVGKMHENRFLDQVGISELAVDATTVVGNGAVHIGVTGHLEGHQTAQTETNTTDFTIRT